MSGKEKTERLARDEEDNQRTMRDGMLRMLLTSEARERLTNIRMVKPDISKIIEDNIIRLASTGKLSPPITDEHIKQLLLSIQKPKREFKIRRV
ncbi:MAG TPA: DNA-binding protein [Nitrososphaerales archaeon]|jgi:programmed cell death protein 5|nr:DNA-binding protein [Nitrososphaerales archaeon]|tara:strand:- start:142 stop:423 length:282 start_codon:yes stop_codon:yes gene_type:complete